MARRAMVDEEVERRTTLVETKNFVGTGSRPRRTWKVEKTREELEEMLRSGDWAEARPKHFVELFLKMHRRVYGVDAIEAEVAEVRKLAARMAGNLMRSQFENDPSNLALFVRWVWRDEERTEAKRRTGAMAGDFKISWKHQWSLGLVTRYRRALVLENGRQNGRG